MSTPGAVSRSALRRRIAEAVVEALGGSGWTESPWHIDMLGSDPQPDTHHTFAVGVVSTVPQRDRQRTDVGSFAATQVRIRWIDRMRADGQVADYGDALDSGEALVAAVLAVEKDPGLSVTLTRLLEQNLIGDGTYLLSGVEFQVLHRLALA